MVYCFDSIEVDANRKNAGEPVAGNAMRAAMPVNQEPLAKNHAQVHGAPEANAEREGDYYRN